MPSPLWLPGPSTPPGKEQLAGPTVLGLGSPSALGFAFCFSLSRADTCLATSFGDLSPCQSPSGDALPPPHAFYLGSKPSLVGAPHSLISRPCIPYIFYSYRLGLHQDPEARPPSIKARLLQVKWMPKHLKKTPFIIFQDSRRFQNLIT